MALGLAMPAPARAQQPAGPAKRPAAEKAPAPAAAVKGPVKAGDTVPMFALRKFGGNFIFLKRYCGKNRKEPAVKAVLLDFFATDCIGCVEQLPELQVLAGKYATKGLETFLISIDPRPEEVLTDFLEEKKITLPVLTDMYRKTFSSYGFATVPQTVLIDGECRAVYVKKEADKGYSAFRDRLETLLK